VDTDDELRQDNDLDIISTENEMIEEPLLAYVVWSLQTGTVENVKKAVLGFFTAKQIGDAKSKLWEAVKSDIIGRKIARKNTNIRSEENANVDDIVWALQKMDKVEDGMPLFVVSAYNLTKIPRSMPEELNNISVVDRIGTLERKIRRMEETIAKNACDIHELETMHENESYEPIVTDKFESSAVSAPNRGCGRGRAKPKTHECELIVPGESSFSDVAQSLANVNPPMTFYGRGVSHGAPRGRRTTAAPIHRDVLLLRRSTQSLNSEKNSDCDSDGFEIGRHEAVRNKKRERNLNVMIN
jgi:hypothetical protein